MDHVISALKAGRANGVAAALELADLPQDIVTAYAVSAAQMGPVAAWKIGGANPWSRAVFDNTEVFIGPLHPEELILDSASVSLAGLVGPLAEPEVMLEIADPKAKTPEMQFSRMALGLELPAAVLPEALKPQLVGQICDRAGAGKLWVSQIHPFDKDRLQAPFEAQLIHNDADPVAASSRNVIGGPLGAAAEFLQLAQRYDLPVAAGQWVATGGLCPAVPLVPGDRLRLSLVPGAPASEIWTQALVLDLS